MNNAQPLSQVPARYTMLYDGQCAFCRQQRDRVQRMDRAQRVGTMDINSAEARARFPQISPEAARRAMHLVAPDGTTWDGADAVRQLLLLLPGWGWLGQAMRLPGAMLLARPVYAWVARHRQFFSKHTCDGGVCST